MRYNLDEIIASNPSPPKAFGVPPLDRVRQEPKKEIIKNKFVFPVELFSGSLVLYLILFLAENLFPGVISREFSINYLLVPMLVFGVASAIFPHTEESKERQPNTGDWWISLIMSILGGLLIYYKIDLELQYRLIIGTVSGLLILMMSFLVLMPKGYQLPKLKFNKYYYLPLIIVPLLIGAYVFNNRLATPKKAIRMAPDKYKIVLVNRSENLGYSEVYKKLLANNGYKNVDIATAEHIPETTSGATVMYNSDDSLAGEEVASLIKLSYADTQTSPLLDPAPQMIVIILK